MQDEKKFDEQLADCHQRLVQMEAQLAAMSTVAQQSNEELKQFVYFASHDFQEPLRAITSYTQLLQQRYGSTFDQNAKDYMGYVVEAAQRMSALLNGLLSYSRISNAERLHMHDVNLVGVIEGAKLRLQPVIQSSGAVITYGDVPALPADEFLLGRLFEELLDNAIRYRGSEPPAIEISSEQQEDMYAFAVADNGIGIHPQYHERIFGLFKRLHGRNVPGTGLGLAICRKVVERHGGKIWVDSQEGEGATFHFTLPY